MRQERATISAGPRRSDAVGGEAEPTVRTTAISFPLNFLKAFVHAVLRGLRFILKFLWHLERQNLNTCKAWMWAGSGKASGRAHRAEDNANNSPLSPGAAPDGYEPCCRYERTSCHGPGSTSTSRRSTFQDALVLVSEPRRQRVLLLSIVRSASKGPQVLLVDELVHLLLPLETTPWSHLHLSQWITQSCNEMGFKSPTNIQNNVIPAVLEGKVRIQPSTHTSKLPRSPIRRDLSSTPETPSCSSCPLHLAFPFSERAWHSPDRQW